MQSGLSSEEFYSTYSGPSGDGTNAQDGAERGEDDGDSVVSEPPF